MSNAVTRYQEGVYEVKVTRSTSSSFLSFFTGSRGGLVVEHGKKKPKSLLAKLGRKLKRLQRDAALLSRFYGDIFHLAPARVAVHFLARIATALSTSLRMICYSRLVGMAQAVTETGKIDRKLLCGVGVAHVLLNAFDEVLTYSLRHNTAVLNRRFMAWVDLKVLRGHERLDTLAYDDPTVNSVLDTVSEMRWNDSYFELPNEVLYYLSNIVSLATAVPTLWGLANGDNLDLIALSLGWPILHSFVWLTNRNGGHAVARISDPNYQRMDRIVDMVRSGEHKREIHTLGLGRYFSREYERASERLGDRTVEKPTDEGILNILMSWRVSESVRQSLLYSIFALRVASQRARSSTTSTVLSLASLDMISNASSNVTDPVDGLMWGRGQMMRNIKLIKAIYACEDLKPALDQPSEEDKVEYKTKVMTNGMRGMEIEFKNVDFAYSKGGSKVLEDASFKILPGEMVAIVGFNGAGKSSLVNVLTRLYDVSEGTILINGHDVKKYSTPDLHAAMSLLFQTTQHFPVTLREYMNLATVALADGDGGRSPLANPDKLAPADGDSQESDRSLERITAASRAGGSLEFVCKLDKGWDTDLGNPRSARIHLWGRDSTSDESDDSDEEGDDTEKEGKKEDVNDIGDDGKRKENDISGYSSFTGDRDKRASGETEKTNGLEGGHDGGEDRGKDELKTVGGTSRAGDDESDDHQTPVDFSGGQWQKLALSRSFMRDADLLLFDEPSASLDPRAEAELFQHVTQARGKMTILYITHRFNLTTKADKILMLSEGRIVEQGTHAELVALPGGKYSELYKLSAQGYVEAEGSLIDKAAATADSEGGHDLS